MAVRRPVPSRRRASAPSAATIRRALVRSRVKVRVLLALDGAGRMYASELAREAHVSPQRLAQAMRGDGKDYARRSALVRLRLVRVREDDWDDVYELTARGRRAARAWRRALVRSWVGASSRAPA